MPRHVLTTSFFTSPCFSLRPETEVGLRLLGSASLQGLCCHRGLGPLWISLQLWWQLCPQPMPAPAHLRNLLRSLWRLCILQGIGQAAAAGQLGEGGSPEHVMESVRLADLAWTVAAP